LAHTLGVGVTLGLGVDDPAPEPDVPLEGGADEC
jgi:hypothetical protein